MFIRFLSWEISNTKCLNFPFRRALSNQSPICRQISCKELSKVRGKGKDRAPAPLRLVLLRHAKSSWDTPVPDRNRALAPRGVKAAGRVAKLLEEEGWLPDLILSSDSVRTAQTLLHMKNAVPKIADVRCLFFASFYDNSENASTTFSEIRKRAVESTAVSGERTVLCLGHDFGWSQCASMLCGEEVELKTANAALLESEAESWAEALGFGAKWELCDVLRVRRKNTS
mmetsp:Transcript_28310/g.39113  ORF Transcript_28310/g.39113 Transcript_28310/m.39113 type:complete len:228 (+) Transcript_28310:196-879(+)